MSCWTWPCFRQFGSPKVPRACASSGSSSAALHTRQDRRPSTRAGAVGAMDEHADPNALRRHEVVTDADPGSVIMETSAIVNPRTVRAEATAQPGSGSAQGSGGGRYRTGRRGRRAELRRCRWSWSAHTIWRSSSTPRHGVDLASRPASRSDAATPSFADTRRRSTTGTDARYRVLRRCNDRGLTGLDVVDVAEEVSNRSPSSDGFGSSLKL
jgi:hypothetical protein